VTAQDSSNNTATGYSGTVHFTSSDSLAILPADSTLSSGSGTFSATFRTAGNQTITGTDTGNSAITGTSSATAVSSGGTAPPVPISVSPAGGSVQTATYAFLFSDPRGYQDLNILNILVNDFLDAKRACYLAYVVPASLLILVNDAGDAGGNYAGTVTLGNNSVIRNSQCAVSLVSATGSGNNFTLTLNITWLSGLAGDRIFYMAGRDQALNNSGWYPQGVVRAPGAAQTTTTSVVSASQSRWTGSTATTLTFTFSDMKGAADFGVENILVNNSLDGSHACYLAFVMQGTVLYLVTDAGDGLLQGQSMAVAGSISNSQCIVSWGAGAVGVNDNNLSLTLTFTFTSSFAGNRILYAAARDANNLNNTGWHAIATWSSTVSSSGGGTSGRPAGAVLDSSNPLAASLIGLFLMNEGSGLSDKNLVDGQTAAFQGNSPPTWNSADPSVVFNGGISANSFLNAGADAIFDALPVNKMTVVARVFLNSNSGGGFAEKNDSNATDSGFIFGLDCCGGLHFVVERSGTNMRVNTASNLIPTGQWIQVAATWDGTVGGAANTHVFLSGTELAKTQNDDGAGTLGYINATGRPFLIGNSTFDSGAGSLNGKMEYLAVYKGRILTPSELNQLDAGLPIR
jgi:hypothetical protein